MFENLEIGPFVAINDMENKQDYIDNLLEEGFVPVALVTDKKNEVFDKFKDNPDYNTQAVFVTVYYKTIYE